MNRTPTTPREAADFIAPEALSAKRKVRRGLERALFYSGAADAFVRATEVAGAVIFLWHSVPSDEEARTIDPRNRISRELFLAQLRLLERRRRVISLEDLTEHLLGGTRPPAGSVVLTFDDGYRDNLDFVAPALASFGFPATLYLPTGLNTRGETPWADQLFAIFTARERSTLQLGELGLGRFQLEDPRDARAAHSALAEALFAADQARREALLQATKAQLAPSLVMPRHTLMWDELRALKRRYPSFTLGVHTVHHLDLTCQSDATVREELSRCIEDFEREVGEPPLHFAYPYNRHDERTRRIVAEFPLQTAVASGPESLITSASDRLALCRLDVPRSLGLFGFWSSGAHRALALRRAGQA
jgi:peptidoglycan/xylan/chitin deacetylase (PgdA/CDA1 family)